MKYAEERAHIFALMHGVMNEQPLPPVPLTEQQLVRAIVLIQAEERALNCFYLPHYVWYVLDGFKRAYAPEQLAERSRLRNKPHAR